MQDQSSGGGRTWQDLVDENSGKHGLLRLHLLKSGGMSLHTCCLSWNRDLACDLGLRNAGQIQHLLIQELCLHLRQLSVCGLLVHSRPALAWYESRKT